MPLLKSAQPLSSRQRKVNKFSLIALTFLGILLGLWEAYACASTRFGYAAAYYFGGAWAFAILFCAMALPLLVYWRSRWIGIGFATMGLLSCATFYAGIGILLKADRVAWRHEPPLVRFGPDQKASIVVYFRHGTSDKEIDDFNSSTLQEPAEPSHPGRDYPPFVSEYLRLLPNQANGYKAIALTFFEGSSSDQMNAFIDRIKSDKRVLKIFQNRSPAAIHQFQP
jgi:hypothetical protein